MFLPRRFIAVATPHDDYLMLVSIYVALFFIASIMFGYDYISSLLKCIDTDSFAMVFVWRLYP